MSLGHELGCWPVHRRFVCSSSVRITDSFSAVFMDDHSHHGFAMSGYRCLYCPPCRCLCVRDQGPPTVPGGRLAACGCAKHPGQHAPAGRAAQPDHQSGHLPQGQRGCSANRTPRVSAERRRRAHRAEPHGLCDRQGSHTTDVKVKVWSS